MAQLDTKIERVAGNQVITDRKLSVADRPGLWATCPLDAIAHDPTLAVVRQGSFATYTNGEGGWAEVTTNSGTTGTLAAAAGYLGGCMRFGASDATDLDNDETYIGTEDETYILANGKDIWFEAEVKFTEANTDDANVFVGLCGVRTADMLIDDGAGVILAQPAIGILKVDGGTTWNGVLKHTTSQATSVLATRNSGAWEKLGFHVVSNTSVDYYVNGVKRATRTSQIPTGTMGIVFGVKNGNSNNETVYVRNWKTVQLV